MLELPSCIITTSHVQIQVHRCNHFPLPKHQLDSIHKELLKVSANALNIFDIFMWDISFDIASSVRSFALGLLVGLDHERHATYFLLLTLDGASIPNIMLTCRYNSLFRVKSFGW